MLGSLLNTLPGRPRLTACVFNEYSAMACRRTGTDGCCLTMSNEMLQPRLSAWHAWSPEVMNGIRMAIDHEGFPRARIATSIPLSLCRWWYAPKTLNQDEQANEAALELARIFGLPQDDLVLECIPSNPASSRSSLWVGCERRIVDDLVGGFSSFNTHPTRIDITELAVARAVRDILRRACLNVGFVLCMPSSHGTSLLMTAPDGKIMGARWVPLAGSEAITAEQWAENTAFEIGMIKLYHAGTDTDPADISLICVCENEFYPWCNSASLGNIVNMPCMTSDAIASRIRVTKATEGRFDSAMLLACVGLLEDIPLHITDDNSSGMAIEHQAVERAA